MNKVILIGNVGNDPEVNHTGSGVKYAKVSLATSERWKDRNGQQQEHTEWHRLTFWDKKADLVEQYVKKGDMLCVVGKIKYSTTEDARSGQKAYWTDIEVHEIEFLTPKGTGSGQRREPQPPPRNHGSDRGRGGYEPPPRGSASPFDANDDDLPF